MASLTGRTPPLLLEVDLTQPLLEIEPADPIAKVRSRGRPRLRATLRALQESGSDARVGGLIARIGTGSPLAIAEEIRAAVQEFAASGKPTVAWAETFGEGGSGTVPYYLATGFHEVWLQPSGQLGLIGVASEVTFVRGLLDKVGVDPQLDKRHEFKNAADRIMRTELSEPHRLAVDRLAESAWETIVAGISAARGLDPATVRALADTGPLPAARAAEAGLVDRLGYRDEVYSDVRRRIGPQARLLFAGRWSPKPPVRKRAAAAVTGRRQPVVALVEGHGAIVTGRSRRSYDGPQLGSDTVAAAIRAARNDDRVLAVVFRVDSPGGSYVASDTVWREVGLTREAGKPVVVSMGTVAGSGGYFVSCSADVIVAQPTTITGSIGVFGGKLVIEQLRDKVGLSTGAIAHGAHARMFSTKVGYSDDERAHLAEELDAIYADFVAKVAQGRGMTRDAVHEIAKGRVWSGADAATNGLVDTLGGLRDATRIARERADLPADAELRAAVQVPMRSKLRSPRSSDDPRSATLSALDLGGWGDLTSIAAALGLPAAGPLMMPNVRIG
jgi:protease IV